jgi:hypothetical protein
MTINSSFILSLSLFFLMSCPNNTRLLFIHIYQISIEYIAFCQIANLIVREKIIAEYSSIIDMNMCHYDFYSMCARVILPFLICRYATFSVMEVMNYIEKVIDLFINQLPFFFLLFFVFYLSLIS